MSNETDRLASIRMQCLEMAMRNKMGTPAQEVVRDADIFTSYVISGNKNEDSAGVEKNTSAPTNN